MNEHTHNRIGAHLIAVTHSGNFHADDIFASAVLRMVHPDISIKRSRDEIDIKNADIVFDVGQIYDPQKKRFDHHQQGGGGVRENGVPYASFGLVWKEYGESLAGSKEGALMIDYKLVMPIDAIDNGIDICVPNNLHIMPYSIQNIFAAMSPNWNEESNDDEVFSKLSDFALMILQREVLFAQSLVLAQKRVGEIYDQSEDKRILLFDKQYPISLLQEYPDVLFVIYENNTKEDWHVKAVRRRADSFDLRYALPEAWAGKEAKELQKITGVKTAKFCHNKRFLVVAETKEDALLLAKLAVSL